MFFGLKQFSLKGVAVDFSFVHQAVKEMLVKRLSSSQEQWTKSTYNSVEASLGYYFSSPRHNFLPSRVSRSTIAQTPNFKSTCVSNYTRYIHVVASISSTHHLVQICIPLTRASSQHRWYRPNIHVLTVRTQSSAVDMSRFPGHTVVAA